MLNTLNSITTNLPDARKYVNWPVKKQNDKGVKFSTQFNLLYHTRHSEG